MLFSKKRDTEGKLMSHIHAEKMMQYAQDAMEYDEPWHFWQSSEDGKDWYDLICGSPAWHKNSYYRRKPKTININGFEVPEPLYFKPEIVNDIYLVSDIVNGIPLRFNSEIVSKKQIETGLWHLTKEAAQIHLDALLSFTKKP
jgi:hypothetical protein